MKITEYPQHDFFGNKLDMIRFESTQKSTKELLFLPGTTEMGIGDGSQLSELYKYGIPKFASQGHEYGYNITAIQPNAKYYGIHNAILPWMQMEHNPSAIIPIGISLGAIEVLDLLTADKYKLIKAVVSLSGKPSASKGIDEVLTRMEAVPGYAYHGTSDTVVVFDQAKKFYEAYNKKFNPDGTLPVGFVMDFRSGVGHSGWDDAMKVGGFLDQWITDKFGDEPLSDLYEVGKLDGLKASRDLINQQINSMQ